MFERVQLIQAGDLSPMAKMGEGIGDTSLPPIGNGYSMVPVVRASMLNDDWEPIPRELPLSASLGTKP
jgi:hypothetical protein